MNRSRRSFCERIGVSLFAAGVAAMSKPAVASDPAPAKLGALAWQLGWLETVEYAGTYVAQNRGYYRAQGVDVTILPGGPNVAVPPLVVAGRALIGNSTISAVAQARASGAALKIVAACWQRNPEVFISLASKPIKTPQELVGKRLGVPSDDLVDANEFLRVNNIRADQVQFVPVQFDPAPLVAGEVDAFFGISTNEPITLAVRGVATHSLALEDFGVPGLYQPYFVREESLADPRARAQLKAFLRGERLGWRDALRDPDLGVGLTLNTYGASLGLDAKQQRLESRATNALVTSPETKTHGLLWMSAAKIRGIIAALGRDGIAVRAAELFDTTLLAEINAETPTT
jgi:ABC-type nitrate/sulfonate/bicarbonate transport system substrate-binding protein